MGNPALPSLNVKEIVEVIESRIPHGKIAVTLMLTLIVLVIVTGCLSYLFHFAVIPIARLAETIGAGKKLNWPASYDALIGLISSILLIWMIQHALKTFGRSLLHFAGKTDDLLRKVNNIEKRLEALETSILRRGLTLPRNSFLPILFVLQYGGLDPFDVHDRGLTRVFGHNRDPAWRYIVGTSQRAG